MTTFTSSRLGSLREKKNATLELAPEEEAGNSDLKLTMPSEQSKLSSYEPTSSFNNTRTSMRLLKGRIQRKQASDQPDPLKSNNQISSENSVSRKDAPPKLSLTLQTNNDTKEDMKLIIHDSPQIQSKKSVTDQAKPAQKKRILIARMSSKEETIQNVEKSIPEKQQIQPPNKIQQMPVGVPTQNHLDEKPIKEQEIQESKEAPKNENELVECPQGCGRKFNRKALEKHSKACKLVFMSKRKEFNSEAKRFISKEQAQIVKQNKLKEKKQMGMTKGKGFDKTGDNWKSASEDFRSALKAIKKQEKQVGHYEDEQEGQQEKTEERITCQYCTKTFSEVFFEHHLENCPKKKEKEKKSVAKKKR